MNNINQAIIIGGGASINDGIALGLWEKIKDRFVIGINFSYKSYMPTFLTFVDASTFYNLPEIHPDLAKVSLIIGCPYQIKKETMLPNTIFIMPTNTYSKDISKGVYSARLSGMYALTLAIHLLDKGEIFLLGYDLGAITQDKDAKGRDLTHYYQGQVNHGGIGKTAYYRIPHREEIDFAIYKKERDVKIYNVSPNSNLNIFEKIDYPTFFSKLDNNRYNQDQLVSEIKHILKIYIP
jgi:hypothetical protein